ncbi:MAG: hypothetical protein P4L61_04240 [Candidatus Pacebacteria bacterium]|nr:hypothetical protein [Candidatus Paceibacterota bacterium]
MICPKCSKQIGFGEQMMGWDEMFGQKVRADRVFIMIGCPSCEKQVAIVGVHEMDESNDAEPSEISIFNRDEI